MGLILFLIYIDKVTSTASNSSNLAIYADDIALYRTIRSSSDYIQIQQDILSVCSWVSQNSLTLNTSKCRFIIFTKKRSALDPTVQLHDGNNHPIQRCTVYRYLGVTFSSNLTWSEHISNISSKARRQIGLIYRNFYKFLTSASLLRLYKSTVRPLLEYACVVWDLFLIKDTMELEDVQKFALKVCLKSRHENYIFLLAFSELTTLAHQRRHLRLTLLIKLHTNAVVYPFQPYVLRELTMNIDIQTKCNSLYRLREETSSAIHFSPNQYQSGIYYLLIQVTFGLLQLLFNS